MMFLSVSLGTSSTLQAHFCLKSIVFSIPPIDKSKIIYIYANTQDQAFTNWPEKMGITDKITQKACSIDLTIKLIENLNAQSKIAIKVDKLSNKDWDKIKISKDKKKVLQKGLAPYIKSAKVNTKYRSNYFECIK